MKNQTLSNLLAVGYLISTLLIFSQFLCNSYSELTENASKENLILIFCALSLSYFVTIFLLKKTK